MYLNIKEHNMREFKFRVWSIEEKQFISPNILEVFDESGDLTPFKYIKTGKLNPLYMPVENYIIQQYTGMKDKYGKEIYEGDVIRGIFDFGPAGFKEEILPVHWHNERGYQWDYWRLITIEVLGNLHEWPCHKPKSFDHNGECLTCDAWATDCPFLKFCPSPKLILKQ
jgi:hypothetical protein